MGGKMTQPNRKLSKREQRRIQTVRERYGDDAFRQFGVKGAPFGIKGGRPRKDRKKELAYELPVLAGVGDR